jgi:serralysin
MAEKPSLDASGAAAQLNRGGGSWSQDLGQATSVSFGFRPDAPNYNPGYPGDYVRLEEPQIVIALLSFQSWSDVANITFTRVGSGTSGEAAYTEQATMLLGGFENGPDIGAYAFVPGQDGVPGNRSTFAPDGDAYFNLERSNIQDPEILWGMRVFTHELGHAIGLDHAGDYAAGQGVTITYEQHAEYREDTSQYTVMSYFDESKTGADYGALTPGAPQLHDIAAAQRLYGANMDTRTGATTYGFGSTADRPWFSAANASSPMIFCVWDAGGRDTFNFAGYAQDQLIDLGQGRFSNVGALTGNVSIAFGAVIEDANGGSGNDTVIGNPVANALSGNAGADSLSGVGGNDTLKGGTGADRLDGGSGTDTVIFGVVAAGLTINLAGGVASGDGGDTLVSIENAVGSRYADTLTGNGSANTLDGAQGADMIFGGGGADRLIGGKGGDQLTGGAAADRFVFLALTDSTTKSPDRIADLGDTDVIDLSAIDANALVGGNQAFVQVARFTGQAGQLTLQWNDALDVTVLKLDDDGDRKADMIIHLDGDQTAFDNFVL